MAGMGITGRGLRQREMGKGQLKKNFFVFILLFRKISVEQSSHFFLQFSS